MESTEDKTLPSWINLDLIQKVLDSERDVDSKVVRIVVKLATSSGDNYASVLRRATAILSDGTQHDLLVKSPPEGANIGSGIIESGMFGRETYMLSTILPQMQALLEEVSPNRCSPLVARCPLHGTDPTPFLVLEDLSTRGFSLTDKKRGLGIRHTLLAVKALARFHAASHVLLRNDPGIAEALDNPWGRNIEGSLKPFTEAGFQNAANACRTWKGFEGYSILLENFKEVAVDTIKRLNDHKKGEFNVITHGDFWLNNLLYCYENGEPKDVRMVDLQLSHVTSPAADLQYFLTSSVSEDVSRNYVHLVVREYHVELNSTLSLLGIKALPLEALVTDLNDKGGLAVYGAVCILPLLKAPKALDLNAIVSGDAGSGAFMYDHPPVRKWLQRVLPEYERNGWLPC